MAEKRDYYEVLGVNKNSSEAEIKRAYRNLAKQYHPDVNSDKSSETKFKEVNEAYEVLGDSEKKAKYDQFGHAAFDPNSFGGFGGFGGGFQDFGFGDIFETIFGGMGFSGTGTKRKNGPQKGQDIKTYIEITFEEAAFGIEKEISINRYTVCSNCNGSGAKTGTSPETCKTCNGSGQVQYKTNTILGQFVNVKTCDTCAGAGQIIKDPCNTCHGKGKIKKKVTLKVNVPAGIDDEQVISLREEGEYGVKGGPRGDLYVVIQIENHPIFKRQGFDVICDIPITFAQATLGAELEVPTLDGTIKYNIPEATQTGSIFKINNAGIKRLRGHGRGDQYLRISIEVPKSLNEKQKEALKLFAELTGDDKYAMRKTFIEKMKDLFVN